MILFRAIQVKLRQTLRVLPNIVAGFGSLHFLALAFICIVLAWNAQWFRAPIREYSDFAANALQVQEAKSFHEMLGNYSRWRFHHPGPFFFYLFALGELLFFNVLKVVPAAFNAHLVTALVFNAACLFGALGIFQSMLPSRLFQPFAVCLSALFLYTASDVGHVAAVVSPWMPDMLVFPFVLFLTACASFAAGRVRYMPLVAACGMALIHGHIAQVLFVVPLWLAAAAGFRATNPTITLKSLYASNSLQVRLTGFFTFVFAFPVVLELLVHTPNNASAVLTYMREVNNAAPNTIAMAFRYFLSCLTFVEQPEILLASPAGNIFQVAFSQSELVFYWLTLSVLLVFAVIGCARVREARNPFLSFLVLEVILVSVLFVFWGTRITGPLYLFNGVFLLAIHLIVLFMLVGVIGLWWNGTPARVFSAGLYVCAVAAIVLAGGNLRNLYAGSDEVYEIAQRAPLATGEVARLDFPAGDNDIALGVASHLHRTGKRFCVVEYWGFMFGQQNICQDPLRVRRLFVGRQPRPCDTRCTTFYDESRRGGLIATLEAPAWMALPLTILTEDTFDVKEGFWGAYEDRPERWCRRRGVIRFLLAENPRPSPFYTVRIVAYTYPGRPAKVFLNGSFLGVIDRLGKGAVEFAVPKGVFRWGGENQLVFEVPLAGAIGNDPRQLGAPFVDAAIQPVL
jgi:hypothetical protein